MASVTLIYSALDAVAARVQSRDVDGAGAARDRLLDGHRLVGADDEVLAKESTFGLQADRQQTCKGQTGSNPPSAVDQSFGSARVD